MILAVDIGNTQTLVGLFALDGKLKRHFRFPTERRATGDQLGVMLRPMLQLTEGDPPVEKAVVSCVAPSLIEAYTHMFRNYFGVEPIFVSRANVSSLPIDLKNPDEIGADRLVNAVAAIKKYGTGQPLLVIDFGTAVTYDVITPDGVYRGGAIACGMNVSAEALFTAAAKLPRVELLPPPEVIGKSTVEALRSGLLLGMVSQVEGMTARITASLGSDPRVIITGGYAEKIHPLLKIPHTLDPALTLEGLYQISQTI